MHGHTTPCLSRCHDKDLDTNNKLVVAVEICFNVTDHLWTSAIVIALVVAALCKPDPENESKLALGRVKDSVPFATTHTFMTVREKKILERAIEF